MRVLLVNKYFFRKGGAETYFFSLADLLKKHGHQVDFFSMRHAKNHDTPYDRYFVEYWNNKDHSLANITKASGRLLYSVEARKKIQRLLSNHRPDLVHLNNIYHQISPSILHTIQKHRIASVMTIHDLKMVCAVYAMYNREKICEACKDGKHYHCFLNKCVKNSRLKSLLGSMEMYLHHWLLNIYSLIDIFISPSQFIKNKLLESGFKGTIEYLPNFVELEGFQPQYKWENASIVYCGRLMRNKGVMTLVDAVKPLDDIVLNIIGDGPLRPWIEEKIEKEHINNIQLLGFQSGKNLHTHIKRAMFTVVPSELYENNPLAVIESFSLGKPVIGSRIGGIPELVIDNFSGLTFAPKDASDLRHKIKWLKSNPELIVQMGINARKYVEQNLSAEKYYERIESLYKDVVN